MTSPKPYKAENSQTGRIYRCKLLKEMFVFGNGLILKTFDFRFS